MERKRMGRRDSTDERWQELKKKVTKRDRKMCRLLTILSATEFGVLAKKAPRKLLERVDHAHVFAVGSFPHMCYNDKNVVLLNRWSHENLDNCRCPITGDPIDRVVRDSWWSRIVGDSVYEELEKVSLRRNKKMEDTKVVLDDKEVTFDELQEQRKRKDVRVIENSDGSFKTLVKLEE